MVVDDLGGGDGEAGGDRWVRISRAVGWWIKDKRPIFQIDGYYRLAPFHQSGAKRARCNQTFADPTQN
jgi:hypothetical protein